jgi:hypothetical protein
MTRLLIALSVMATLGVLSTQAAVASTGATFTVNPELQQAILLLDSGEKVTANASTEVFTLQAPNGQSVSLTFAQVASGITGIPSEQQALIQQWRTKIRDQANKHTITNKHEPTLALPHGGVDLPPGDEQVYGAPVIDGNDPLSTLGDGNLSAVQSGTLGSGPVHRALVH